MTKLELGNINLHLEHELNNLSQTTDAIYRNALKDDVRKVVLLYRNEIDDWMLQLNARFISCYDIQNLLESKKEVITLTGLKSTGMKNGEIELLKDEVIRLIAKSILNTYLDSLYKKPTTSRKIEIRNGNWF